MATHYGLDGPGTPAGSMAGRKQKIVLRSNSGRMIIVRCHVGLLVFCTVVLVVSLSDVLTQ